MRVEKLLIPCILVAGCAGRQAFREGEMAPYKAVVVFEWFGKTSAGQDKPAPGGGHPAGDGDEDAAGGLSREDVETEILHGLGEYEVFSDYVPATWEGMYQVAEREKADLIVLVCIKSLGQWEAEQTRTVTGLAILEGLLWLGTGIGSWWVPDLDFPTRSNIEVFWKRPGAAEEGSEDAPSVVTKPSEWDDAVKQFSAKGSERLQSGDSRLSFWDRARPWRYPWAYLMSIVVPPVFVPIHDRQQVDRSLASSALEDIKRELAFKLRSGYLGSAGSPFLFRLREPVNGGTVDGEGAKVVYSYDVQPGFEAHEATGLSELHIDIKPSDRETYEPLRAYKGDEIDRIKGKKDIEQMVDRLGPGKNLVRFRARPRMGGEWVTNTVALVRR